MAGAPRWSTNWRTSCRSSLRYESAPLPRRTSSPLGAASAPLQIASAPRRAAREAEEAAAADPVAAGLIHIGPDKTLSPFGAYVTELDEELAFEREEDDE